MVLFQNVDDSCSRGSSTMVIKLHLKWLRHSCDFHQLTFSNKFQTLSSLSHCILVFIISLPFYSVFSLNHCVSMRFYSKILMVVVQGVLGWGSQLDLQLLRHSCDFHQLSFSNKMQTSSTLSHCKCIFIISMSFNAVISLNHCVSMWFHFKILTMFVQGLVGQGSSIRFEITASQLRFSSINFQ